MTFSAPHRDTPTILTVPGLDGSGPGHWQTRWEAQRVDTVRAELGVWNSPHRNTWVTKLDQAIASARAPVVLAAHSLGCLAVAWWAHLAGQPYGWPVIGALLVAPADVERAVGRPEVAGFAPHPRVILPFPSLVVASSDDPWTHVDRAHSLAASWGAEFLDIGARGHINADSDLGDWHEGQALLARFSVAPGASPHHPPGESALRRPRAD